MVGRRMPRLAAHAAAGPRRCLIESPSGLLGGCNCAKAACSFGWPSFAAAGHPLCLAHVRRRSGGHQNNPSPLHSHSVAAY